MDPNTQSTSELPAQPDRHEQSKAEYPGLNLSENEYVLQAIERHPIGKLGVWAMLGIVTVLVIVGLIFYGANYTSWSNNLNNTQLPSAGIVALPGILVIVLLAIGAFIASKVYDGNRIYLTNESLIQHVQTSLFSTKNEQLNLVKIEDVTVAQDGLLPKMLNYGTVEINTMDSGDPHILTLVRNTQSAADAIHNAAEQAIRANPQSRSAASGPATA
jgi:hypothetical protein